MGKKIVLFFMFSFALFFNKSGYCEDLSNAATFYIQAANSLVGINKGFLKQIRDVQCNGLTNSDTEIIELIKRNKPSLDLFKHGDKISFCDFTFGKSLPKDISGLDYIPDYLQESYLLGLVLIQGQYLETLGDDDSAFNSYMAAGKYIYQWNNTNDDFLLTKLLGIIFQNRFTSSLKIFIGRTNLTIPQYKQILGLLGEISKSNQKFKDGLLAEKEISLSGLNLFFNDLPRKINYLPKNQRRLVVEEFSRINDKFFGYTLKALQIGDTSTMIESCNKMIRNLEEELGVDQIRDKDQRDKRLTKVAYSSRNPIMIAKSFFLISYPRFISSVVKLHIAEMKIKVLMVAIEKKMFQIENGRLPSEWEDIPSHLVAHNRQDIFNNFSPIVYRNDGGSAVVYSFGPDYNDDGGELKEIDWCKGIFNEDGDISITIEDN
ncbi:MAG: hypothetical protein PHV17_07405 [Candidatus Omnitrophica bacterium]|nr:hypothetical protein [Candidatus Omnitrophota bacterium]